MRTATLQTLLEHCGGAKAHFIRPASIRHSLAGTHCAEGRRCRSPNHLRRHQLLLAHGTGHKIADSAEPGQKAGTSLARSALCCRKEVQAAQVSLEAATVEVQRLSAALQEVRGRAEQRRADVAAQSSQGAVVKALMAAKSAGSLPGIYGRLGEPNAIHPAAWQDTKDCRAGYGAACEGSSNSQPVQHSRMQQCQHRAGLCQANAGVNLLCCSPSHLPCLLQWQQEQTGRHQGRASAAQGHQASVRRLLFHAALHPCRGGATV